MSFFSINPAGNPAKLKKQLEKLTTEFETLKTLCHEQEQLINSKVFEVLPTFEALDQHKVYLCQVTDGTELQMVQNLLSRVKQHIPWTTPHLVGISKEFKELTETELKRLLKIVQANKQKK